MSPLLVQQANVWADEWAQVLWRASWQGGLFITLVWLACRMFPKIPAAYRHGLWWLATVQLLIRLVVATPVALPLLPAQPDSVHLVIRRAPVYVQNEPIIRMSPVSAESAVKPISDPVPPLRPVAHVSTTLALLIGWLVVVLVGLAVTSLRVISAIQLVRSAKAIGNPRMLELLLGLSSNLGVRPPQMRESGEAPCPLLAGWWRPTIVFPSASAGQISEDEATMAIAHELAHLRRHDLWLGIVPVAAQTLFFFHPLAWLAVYEAASAREEACDSEAIQVSGGSPAAYARLLLSSTRTRSSAAAMGVGTNFRLIRRRIIMLNSSSSSFSRRPSRGFLVALAVGVVCAIPWSVTAQSPSSTKSTNHKQVVHIKKHSKSKQRRLIAIKTKAHSVRGTGSNHADTAKRASGLPMRSQVGFGVRLASPTAPVATGLASARQVVAGTTPIGTSSAAVPSVPLAGWSRPAQTGSATAGVIGTTSIPASPTGVVAGVGIGTTAAPVLLQVGSAAGASPTTRASVPAGQVIGQNIAAGVTPAVPGQNTWTAPRVGQFPSTSSAMAGSPFAVPAVHSGRLGFGVTPWASTRRGTIQVALTGRRGELTVHLDNASLRDAIIQLFDRAGKNYVLKGDIVGTATVSLHNLPFDSILRALLHAGPIPLTFRVDSGVYTISSTK